MTSTAADDDAIAHYRALLQARTDLAEAVCVTYVHGVDEDTMIRAFGGDPADTARLSLAGLYREQADYHFTAIPHAVLVTTVGDWLIGIEPNGYQGSRPEVLRAASAGGTALSVYWNVNAVNQFAYARHGRTLASFDMMFPDDREGAEPAVLDAYLDGLPFDDDTWEAGLVLAERISGVRLTAALLDGTFRRAVLRPVPQDLVPEALVGHPALDEPFVREVLAAPTVDKLPAITRYLAEMVARAAEIDDAPEVRAALAALASGVPAEPALRERVQDLADRYEKEAAANPELLRRFHAVLGIAGALDPDPATASFEVYWRAGYSLRDQDDVARKTVLGRCRSRALAPNG